MAYSTTLDHSGQKCPKKSLTPSNTSHPKTIKNLNWKISQYDKKIQNASLSRAFGPPSSALDDETFPRGF